MRELVFDGFGRKLVAGIENEKIFNAADDAPVAGGVDFALIAGVEPAIAQYFGGFFGAVPVTGKNIRTADDDFVVFGEMHLDAGDSTADVAGLHREARVVEGAKRGGFREAVSLQDGNAEHSEPLL